MFSHNGREFSPTDVLGLSSVGLSTKTGRTIGFMGVSWLGAATRRQLLSLCYLRCTLVVAAKLKTTARLLPWCVGVLLIQSFP